MSSYKELPPEHPFDIQHKRDQEKAKSEIFIRKMPNKETLTEYVSGFYGKPKVVFDRKLGEFIWVVKQEKKQRSRYYSPE